MQTNLHQGHPALVEPHSLARVLLSQPSHAHRDGTADEVREQVLRRCEIFSRGGGFVFNTIHNIQAQTPVENIVAMLEAVHEFGGKES